MKEQLTLEMLCSYLPYGLKVIFEADEFQHELVGLVAWCDEVMVVSPFNDYGRSNIKNIKPIFHPLSELEGTEQWNKIVSEHNYPDFGHFERSVVSGHAPHKLIIELVKEHFWIYDQSYFEKKIILDYNNVNGL